MFMKKRIYMLAAVLMVFAMLVSCGDGGGTGSGGGASAGNDANNDRFAKLDDANIKVLYWVSEAQYNQDKSELENYYNSVWDAKAEFESKYGGKVEFIITPWDQTTTSLITMINTGDVPDVVNVHNQNFPLWPAKNAVQPLDEYLDFSSGNFNPVVTNAYTFGGKKYAAGSSVAPVLIYYNKTLFEENAVKDPGAYYKEGKWNWEAFKTCGKEMTYDDISGFAWWEIYMQLIYSNGGQLFKYNDDESISVTLTDEASLEALKFYQDGILTDKFINATFEGSSFISAFENGKVAMSAEYSLGKYGNTRYDIGVVPFPTGPKGQTDAGPGGCSGWGLATGAKNPKGGAAFVWMIGGKEKKSISEDLYNRFDKADVDMYLRCAQKVNYTPDSGVSDFFVAQFESLTSLKSGTSISTVAAAFQTALENSIKKTFEAS